jgi:hypothetical protein
MADSGARQVGAAAKSAICTPPLLTAHEQTAEKPQPAWLAKWSALLKENGYSIYVLLVLFVAYLFNQLDRFTVGVVSKEVSAFVVAPCLCAADAAVRGPPSASCRAAARVCGLGVANCDLLATCGAAGGAPALW